VAEGGGVGAAASGRRRINNSHSPFAISRLYLGAVVEAGDNEQHAQREGSPAAATDRKMRGDMGEMWGDMGRCGEMWGDVGRCWEMWGDSTSPLSATTPVSG